VAVNSDCTGTITFINSQGIMRTDSVVVLSQNELRGMSQDINNLWTYTARRIERSPGADVLASKINAIMRKLIVNPLIFEDDGYVAP
jgi:hypothetical protein